MHVKSKQAAGSNRRNQGDQEETRGGKHLKSLTFTDAIHQYSFLIQNGDMDQAYKKAANNFNGQMRQHFVVLADLKHGQGGVGERHQQREEGFRGRKRQTSNSNENKSRKK